MRVLFVVIVLALVFCMSCEELTKEITLSEALCLKVDECLTDKDYKDFDLCLDAVESQWSRDYDVDCIQEMAPCDVMDESLRSVCLTKGVAAGEPLSYLICSRMKECLAPRGVAVDMVACIQNINGSPAWSVYSIDCVKALPECGIYDDDLREACISN